MFQLYFMLMYKNLCQLILNENKYFYNNHVLIMVKKTNTVKQSI